MGNDEVTKDVASSGEPHEDIVVTDALTLWCEQLPGGFHGIAGDEAAPPAKPTSDVPAEKAAPTVKSAPPALLARPEAAAAANRGSSAEDIPEARRTADALRSSREISKVALATGEARDIEDALQALDLAKAQMEQFSAASKAAGSSDDEIQQRLEGMHAPETLAMGRSLRDKKAGAAPTTPNDSRAPGVPEGTPKAETKPGAIDTPWQAERGSK